MSVREYNIDGKYLEMYTIGELARRLDRQLQTIRKWEKEGLIPQAIYRSGSNRRLYTRNQMMAIIGCVNKYKIKQGQAIPKEFKEEVHEIFKVATDKDFED